MATWQHGNSWLLQALFSYFLTKTTTNAKAQQEQKTTTNNNNNNKQQNSIKYRVVGKKEVISPTLTIKVIGFFTILVLSFFLFKVRQFRACGLKLYILNKMKNTFFKPDASFAFYSTLLVTEGKKNNTYKPTILNKKTP